MSALLIMSHILFQRIDNVKRNMCNLTVILFMYHAHGDLQKIVFKHLDDIKELTEQLNDEHESEAQDDSTELEQPSNILVSLSAQHLEHHHV